MKNINRFFRKKNEKLALGLKGIHGVGPGFIVIIQIQDSALSFQLREHVPKLRDFAVETFIAAQDHLNLPNVEHGLTQSVVLDLVHTQVIDGQDLGQV